MAPTEKAPRKAFPHLLTQPILDRIGANVGALRAARGWSQTEAGFRCGNIARSMFQSIECGGGNITVDTLARLCEGFGVDVVVLVAPTTATVAKRPVGRPATGE